MTGITINSSPYANYSYYTVPGRLVFVYNFSSLQSLTSSIFMVAISNFYLFTSLFNLIILLPIKYLHSMKAKVLKLTYVVFKLCHKRVFVALVSDYFKTE